MENVDASKPSAESIHIIRGLLAQPTDSEDTPWQPVILRSLRTKEALEFAASKDNAGLDVYPRPLVKGDTPALCLALENTSPDGIKTQVEQEIAAYKTKHDAKPGIICLKGYGLLYVDHTDDDSDKPLKNKVALVTGSAGAIGYGVCKGLLEAGAYLAASDLPGERFDELTEDLEQIAPNRVLGVPLDVTDAASIAKAFQTVTETFGGIDILIHNAGIAMAGLLKDIDMDEFRHLEKVNIEGTLLTLRAISDHMIAQATGGDIVIMSSKTVPAPGAGFGGYSTTKAACHQLGRLASIELAPNDIRVNMVAPDAVFSEGKFKSGLWEKVGPDRMKARGLDQAGLQEYYRTRNLLKARVTGKHVANAVIFLTTRQTPTTGATIPVDGGLPDATPR